MKRVITIILAMAMALSICSIAYAEENAPTVKISRTTVNENNGIVEITADIDNFTGKTWNIEAIYPNNDGAARQATLPSDTTILPGNTTKTFTASVLSDQNTTGTFTFVLSYRVVEKDTDGKITKEESYASNVSATGNPMISRNPKTTPEPTEAPKKEDSEFRIRTSSVDSNGVCVLTPSGDYGDQLEVRLPLTCTNGYVYDLKVTPVLSNDIEKFPFDIDLVDYTLSYPGSIGKGQVVEFLYHLRLSKKATVGVKQVDFNVTYRNEDGDLKTGTVNLFVNVRKGLSPTSDKDTTTSVPKLIIESYKLSSDKIYAGETFDLEFTIKNTSDSTNLQNVQIHIKDAGETATIVPASGGSNTLYISKIGKGQSSSQKVSLQTAPDATAKAYTLNVDFSYESASTNAAHTANETIAVPILQKIRLSATNPRYTTRYPTLIPAPACLSRCTTWAAPAFITVSSTWREMASSLRRATSAAPSAPAPPLRQIYP